ncbi:ArsR/SmtB family transcription factor [Fictibacillus phosphorivorans]|uniref:ArsR/SmtB family transcription factor n=1 Tax=Fictibacillus phosphorivorans TaxID=1221500 RepID=UPI001294169C|nr:winged helix-turn-helix domain-containing protein [Fictibacillus phosphorivorans]MQR97146.1 ArsR family transcriptional regulator [Fictibacillus phosphorivorans]
MTNSLSISADQQKLIANATRIQIIHLLKGEELTAKEVADKLGKTAGTVHYHIQLLFNGGILELVKEHRKGGIIEKYYRSKSTRFELIDEDNTKPSSISTNLLLDDEEKKQFLLELEQLFVRWESQVTNDSTKKEYKVYCTFQENA